jgi:hypothetical protein
MALEAVGVGGGKAMGDSGVSAIFPDRESLLSGAHVEVRDRFTGAWSRGFELEAIVEGGYRIRRLSDGSVLPTVFLPEDVRPRPPRKAGLWWYR